MEEIADVLARLESRGLRVWSDDGQLRYKGPAHPDNRADLARLSQQKSEVAAYLKVSQDRLPLSLPQRIWIRPPGSPPTAVELRRTPATYLLTGPLDADHLAQALDVVVARHPILRTRYRWDGDQGFQTPLDRAPPPMGRVDLSTLPEDMLERAVSTVMKEAHDRPVDYGAASPFRAWLFKFDTERHLLGTLIDHVALDNRSANIIHFDIFDQYHALVMGDRSRIVPYPTPYAAYVRDNLERHAPARTTANLAWWRNRLNGAEPTNLREPGKAPYGDYSALQSVPFRFPPELCGRIQQFARGHSLSVSIVLNAGLGVMLSRWARADKVLAAHVIDDRTQAMAGTVGCFVRSSPFFLDLTGNPTGQETFERTRQAYADLLNPERAIFADDIPGLRRVMINLQTPRDKAPPSAGGVPRDMKDPETFRAGGLTFKPVPMKGYLFDRMSLDLQIFMKIHLGQVTGHITYAAERLDGRRAVGFARGLPEVLRGMVEAPESLAAQLGD